jgi:hypothetical protein
MQDSSVSRGFEDRGINKEEFLDAFKMCWKSL